MFKKLTPVLLVERVEDALPFWTERLGFTIGPSVPLDDGSTGFVILSSGGVEVMLQSRASVLADEPGLAKGPFAKDGVGLFIEVDDLDPVLRAVEASVAAGESEIVVHDRRTFYGMREVGVLAPGGCVVVFAQKLEM